MTPEIKQRIEQIRRGKVPEGYKKVKMWMCPVEWKVTTLNTVADVGQGYTFKREYQGQSVGRWNYFKVADIGLKNTGIYLSSAINKVDDSLIKQMGCKPFSAGSIVFPRVGAALLNNNKRILLQDSIVDDNVLVLTVKDVFTCNNIFLYYLLSRLRLEDWCNSGLVPVINSKTVLKQTVNLPPIEEQQKIAAILTTQDRVIELKEKRLAEKQQQKKYLMQQLLTGKKRLPGFNGECKKTKLKNILHERKTYSPKGLDYPHVTLSTEGIFPKSERYDRDHLVKDEVKEYKITHKGDICYNPANLKFGAICENTFGDAIFSPIYVTFEVRKNVCREYLANYLMRWDFINAIRKYEEGTVYERMAVKPEDFLKFEIFLPQIEEQTAIAEVFSAADREIELLRQDIEQEKQKKKSLMQLLLTGIVRVKV